MRGKNLSLSIQVPAAQVAGPSTPSLITPVTVLPFMRKNVQTPAVTSASDDDEPGRDGLQFSPEEDEILWRTFETHSCRTDIAPFPPNMPPSGLTTVVARDAIYRWKVTHAIRFRHSLASTRRRLIQLCRDPSMPSSILPTACSVALVALTRERDLLSPCSQDLASPFGEGFGGHFLQSMHKPGITESEFARLNQHGDKPCAF